VFDEIVEMETVPPGIRGDDLATQNPGIGVGNEHRGREPRCAESIGEIPSEVPEHRGVVGVELRGRGCRCRAITGRNLQIHAASGSEDPEQLSQCPIGVGYVFQHMRSEDHIEGRGGKSNVLEIDLEIGPMRSAIEIAGPVVEEPPHHHPVSLAETRTGLEDPGASMPQGRCALHRTPPQKAVTSDRAASRTGGGFGVMRAQKCRCCRSADVAPHPTVEVAPPRWLPGGSISLPPFVDARSETEASRDRAQTILHASR